MQIFGSGGCVPAGPRGSVPGQGVGVKPPEAENFSLHKYQIFAFLSRCWIKQCTQFTCSQQ